MSTTTITPQPAIDPSIIERVLLDGDLAKLSPAQRVAYYGHVCESIGLSPLTQPFAYITLNGKLRLYAMKDATDQLRKIHGVSITKVETAIYEGIYMVTAYAQDASGRTDAATGAVALGYLKGEARANALMKTETKAKRRVTLSICGLGMLDETEIETIPPGAKAETVMIRDGVAATGAPSDVPAAQTVETLNQETGELVDDALPEHSVLITDVRLLEQGENERGPWHVFVMTTSDGMEYAITDAAKADEASEYQQQRRPVEIWSTRVKGKQRPKVTGLRALHTASEEKVL